MNSCKYIKELIDEAERPDLLPLDVEAHIGACPGCKSFANDRAALRTLLVSNTRVTAPPNFDAMLKSRLAEVKTRRPFWWIGTPVYLRFGAATAGLIVMFFAAQYAGLFNSTTTTNSQEQAFTLPPTQPPAQNPSILPPVPPRTQEPEQSRYSSVVAQQRFRRPVPIEEATTASLANPSAAYMSPDDGVVLVRGRNGDVDVQMPTVSVGAQPLLYVSAGQHRAVRNVGTSF